LHFILIGEEEVDTIIDEIFGIDAFNIIINGDQFEGKGSQIRHQLK
jgi:hypothetical protein